MISLATRLVYRFESEYGDSPRSNDLNTEEAVTDDILDQIKEEYLDSVYGPEARLYREEYF